MLEVIAKWFDSEIGLCSGNECITLRVLAYFTNSWVCGPIAKEIFEAFHKEKEDSSTKNVVSLVKQDASIKYDSQFAANFACWNTI